MTITYKGKISIKGKIQNYVDAVSLPGSPIVAYLATDYDSTNKVLKPKGSSTTYQNLNPYSMGPLNGGFTLVSVTATDHAIASPDGKTDGHRIVGTGNWYFHSTFQTVNGQQYTMAFYARGNGADKTFVMSALGVSTSGTKTATNGVWTRFTHTFTGNGSSLALLYAWSPDGSTGTDMYVANMELFKGASDLGPEPTEGQVLFSATPTVSGGVVDLSTAYGIMTLPSSTTMTTFTVQSLYKVTGAGGGYNSFFSALGGAYSNFTAYYNVSGQARNILTQPMRDFTKWVGQDYHVITHRYDGTIHEIFIDGVRAFWLTGSYSAATLRHIWMGNTNTVVPTAANMAGVAVWNSALTNAEVGQSVRYWRSYASKNGLTMGSKKFICAEGDSITEGLAGTSYAQLVATNSTTYPMVVVSAVSGSTIGDVVSRAADNDKVVSTAQQTSNKFIYTILLGANDLGVGGSEAGFLSNLETHIAARKAAGWTTVVCTILPKGNDSAFNTRRNSVNSTLAGWVGAGKCDYLCDFAADAIMGPDTSYNDNPSYWNDTIHPNTTGGTRLEPIYRAVIDSI